MVSQAFLYQRGLLHVCPGADQVLRRGVGPDRAVSAPVRGGQLPRARWLGHWFDTIGRKPMIAATYSISAVLLT